MRGWIIKVAKIGRKGGNNWSTISNRFMGWIFKKKSVRFFFWNVVTSSSNAYYCHVIIRRRKIKKRKTHLSSRGRRERTATGRKFPTTFLFVLIIIVIKLKNKKKIVFHYTNKQESNFHLFPFLKIKNKHNLANEIFLNEKRSRGWIRFWMF